MLNLDKLSAIDLDAPIPIASDGKPLHVHFNELYEDPNNPRTEFDPVALQALADDIAVVGILQPIVVSPRDERGYKIQHGASRRRAAEMASLVTGKVEVPIFIRDSYTVDPYAQMTENSRRSPNTPMEHARFIAARIESGDTKAYIAKRLGFAAGRIPEFLSLLSMAPSIQKAYQEGRCLNPQAIYVLTALQQRWPNEVDSWLDQASEVTRAAIADFEAAMVSQNELRSKKSIVLPPEEGVSKHALPPEEAATNHADINTSQRPKSLTKSKSIQGAKKGDPDIRSLERRMTDSLGARSTILFNDKAKTGTLKIRFTSLAELDGLIKRMKIKEEP